MSPVASAAVGVALLLDLLVAELPARVHPVAAFGRVVDVVDRAWARPRLVGLPIAAVLPLGAAVVVGGVTAGAAAVAPVLGGVVAGVAVFATTSLRMLVSVAGDVIGLTETDLDRARTEVRALVGRDASALSPAEIRSAAAESAAENLADGLVAPLLAFALGARVSLAVGVGAAVWVKAVNTLDSMLGYRSRPVGWASARLDDAVMWVPARVTAVLVAAVARSPGALSRARRWAHAPPSPNSGWPMATLAAALDVRLSKPGAYVLNPDRELPSADRARRGVALVGVAGLVAFAGAGVLAWS